MSQNEKKCSFTVGQSVPSATTVVRLKSKAVLVNIGNGQVAILRASEMRGRDRLEQLSAKGASVDVEVISIKESSNPKRDFDIEVSERRFHDTLVVENLKPDTTCKGTITVVKPGYMLVTINDPAADNRQGILHSSRVPGFREADFEAGSELEVAVDSVNYGKRPNQPLRIALKLSVGERKKRFAALDERVLAELKPGDKVACNLVRLDKTYMIVRLTDTVARSLQAVLPYSHLKGQKGNRDQFLAGLKPGERITGTKLLSIEKPEGGRLRISVTQKNEVTKHSGRHRNREDFQRNPRSYTTRRRSNDATTGGAQVTAVTDKGYEVSFGVGGAMPGFLPLSDTLNLKVGDRLEVVTDDLAGLTLNDRVLVKVAGGDDGEAGNDQQQLLARAKQLGVKGANSRWGEDALRRKVRAALS